MDTAQIAPPAPPQAIDHRKRRINMQIAEAICRQVARGLSESHAVCVVGQCTPQQWFNWKGRGKRSAKVAELITRLTAHRVDRMAGEIERAATGSDGIRHDWRAAQFLAGVVDQRFALQRDAQTTVNQSVMSIHVGGLDALRRLVESCAPAPRQLTDAASPGPTEQPAIAQDQDQDQHQGSPSS